MPPKKKEEEAPPPEECLPAGWAVGCALYWCDESRELGDEGGDAVKMGMRGTLQEVTEVEEYEKEDGTKGFAVENVVVLFEEHGAPHRVAMKSISLEAPPLEMMDELSTGLKLVIKGGLLQEIWQAEGDYEEQTRLLTQRLGLEEACPAPSQRQIVCDFHIFNLAHAKSVCLTKIQACVFVTIMANALEMMRSDTATGATKPSELCTASTCFKEFERLILQHAGDDPPRRLGIFKNSEVKLLTDFVSATLFKHFLLYQYCVNFDREVQMLRFEMRVEKPNPPLDLTIARPRERESEEVAAPDQSELAQEAGGAEDEDLTEEEREVERIVKEKLEATEARLMARLEEREDAFKTKLESLPVAAPKKKGK